MSEPKLISPLLDNFAMGDAISDRGGVRICPAIDQNSKEKFIVKIISNPASPSQLDALVLTGAYADRAQALDYYKTLSNDIQQETAVLNKLSELDGFVACSGSQIEELDDSSGYDVYILTPYRTSLERYWTKTPMSHLAALNLGLDLCSALSVCRRCGFLYVALSPENVYLIDDKGFKIGDIGFIPLNSLKYASLPDRYRSAYTPPEIEDAYASINTTIDVYAVGLLLYQVFNGGVLPNFEDSELPPPEFADYEMSEIILKACAKDPQARWEDPAQMGQALVDYMQRNGAHDTPIVPIPVIADEEPVTEPEIADIPVNTEAETIESDNADAIDEPVQNEEFNSEELGVLLTDAEDETLPDADDMDTGSAVITEEVSDMLNQADDLIAHETPAPVIPPEPIDVQLPLESQEEAEVTEELVCEQSTEEEPAEPETAAIVPDEEEQASEDAENSVTDADENVDSYAEDELDYEPKKKNRWLRNTLLILLSLCLIAGGFLFYKLYYLQHIDSLKLVGDDLSLTVQVNTQTDESLLNVICYDTYGNQLQSPVVNGKAVFDELAPDCAYTVKVSISGFHSLTGQIAVNYSTPKQTNIVQFTATTGAEDGSAILSFSVDGPDLDSWIIRRSAKDEKTEEFPCSEHTYTFTGLTVGTEYTFELLSAEGKTIVGQTKITHTANKLITAENAVITSCQDEKLTVVWDAPNDTQVSSWTAHCFNDKGYDKSLTVTELTAVFDGIVTNDPYTVEITAAGMSVSQRLYVPENAVTISNFAVTTADSTSITLSWVNGNNKPENGWILQYSIDGSPVKEVTTKNADSVKLTPYIPDCTYQFTLLTADSVDVVGGRLNYETKKASDFSGYSVKRSNMTFSMCQTPNVSNWDKSDVRSTDYTTDFKIGQKASFLVRMNKKYGVSSNKIYVTYVIRDSENNVVNFSTKETKWSNMWSNNYGEFDLPALPKVSGKYTVTVYFNDAIAGHEDFRMK